MNIHRMYVSLAELSVITGLTKSSLWHHIRSGRIKVARVLGRRLLFDVNDFWARETDLEAKVRGPRSSQLFNLGVSKFPNRSLK